MTTLTDGWKPCPFCGRQPYLFWDSLNRAKEAYYANLGEHGSACISIDCKCNLTMYEQDNSVRNFDEKLEALRKKWNTRKELSAMAHNDRGISFTEEEGEVIGERVEHLSIR